MDLKFHPAVAAVRSGDLEKFRSAVEADPSLATARSSRSHPTLLQCVALDGNGAGGWSPIEEALYWNSRDTLALLLHRAMVEFLLQRGADSKVKDTKVGSDAAGWAAHTGQTEIVELLQRAAPKT